jgi:hypothetical protein
MYSDQQLNWRSITMAGCVIALFAWSLILVIGGAPAEEVFHSLVKYGLVSSVVFGAWRVFVMRGWRWKWVRAVGLVRTPDLNGRWVGTSVSSYDGKSRPMTVEIRQNLLRIHCIGYGPENIARGYSARILCDPDEQKFMLTYLYTSKRKAASSVPGDQHEGVKVLSLIDGPPRRLRGFYLNDRDPTPRKADMDLRWESARLREEL